MPLSALHDEYDWLKTSLDGWVEATRVVLEIKAPNAADHALAPGGGVPAKYTPQLDHLLLATGGTSAHYVSYSENPKFGGVGRYALVEYRPDPERLRRLLELCRAFWAYVESDTQPPDTLLGKIG